MTNDCQNLDAYLNGELAPGDGVRFAAHLSGCAACREAVDEQQWIDGLLRCPAIAQLETPSPALLKTIHGALALRRRRVRLAACGLAATAAAALLVAVGWTTLSRQTDVARPTPVAKNDVAHAATFVGGPDVIAVPVESDLPDVTIVRVYPVYEPDYPAQFSLDPMTPGDEFAWPDLNGG